MPRQLINDGLTRFQRYAIKHRNEINERKRLYRQNPAVKAKDKEEKERLRKMKEFNYVA